MVTYVIQSNAFLLHSVDPGWSWTPPGWLADARVALVLGALGLALGAVGWYLRYITRWFRILLFRNGLETYYKPGGAWAILAKKCRGHWAQVSLASPIIEMDSHKYTEVMYLDLWNVLWPTLGRYRFVILRDAEQAEHRPDVIQKVMGLRVILLTHTFTEVVRLLRNDVVRKRAIFSRSINIPEVLAWHREHYDSLRKCVSEDALASFLDRLDQTAQSLLRDSEEATKALAVLDAIRYHEYLSAELIMALRTLIERTDYWRNEFFRSFAASAELSNLLLRELARQQPMWRKDRELSSLSRKAREKWQLVAAEGRKSLPWLGMKPYPQRWKEIAQGNARMRATYAVLLAPGVPSQGGLDEYTLTDLQLGEVMSKLTTPSC